MSVDPQRAPPVLLTFDVYGTVLDWRRGLREALAAEGVALDDAAFDRVVDWQGAEEQRHPGRRYRAIVEESLRAALGLGAEAAARVAEGTGRWPPYPDSAPGLRRLRALAPCAALTNSDLAHRAPIEAALGFALDGWLCAEELGLYKPSPEVWRVASQRLGAAFGPRWWHVSAYADYDLRVARGLGLTTVLVRRPHRREAPADVVVDGLDELAGLLGA